MENLKEPLDSSPAPPSLISQLFGSKGSAPPSSTANISSIFPPPPRATVIGKSSDTPELVAESSERISRETSEDLTKIKKTETGKGKSSIFLERMEPSPLSSSLYYGGPEDMYMRSPNMQSSGSVSEYKKDDDDRKGADSHFASRGNWWEGSLYY